MPANTTRKRVTRVIDGIAFETTEGPAQLSGIQGPEYDTQKGQKAKGRMSVSKKLVDSKPKELSKAE